MRIITLGTSHGNHTEGRFVSSTLLIVNETPYLIDAGEPASAQIWKTGVPFSDIRAVFITHMHDDHTSGLTALCKAIRKYPVQGKTTGIWFPEERAIPAFRTWLTVTYMDTMADTVSYHTVQPGVFYKDENICVTAIPTAHIKEGKSFAYLMEGEGKKVLFSGDLDADFHDFPKTEGHIDLCVCEATHYHPRLARPVFEKSDFGRLVFNHVHELYIGEGEDLFLNRWYADLPYPVAVAHDMETFTVGEV